MRIAMGLEYDGTAYYGWQRQCTLPSIQERVESALSRIANHAVSVQCAGRTDAGVHAMGQVIHFDSTAQRTVRAWILGGNNELPADIRVLWAKPVVEDFHARYSAVAREYRYSIYNHHVASALFHKRAMWCRYELDVERMQAAAFYLLGEHDFSSFRGSGCQSRSPCRRVTEIKITQGGNMVNITVKGNAFLLHMVRNIVGSLVLVGTGQKSSSWMQELLMAKDRRLAGVTAPAHGLYLVRVEYPQHLLLS